MARTDHVLSQVAIAPDDQAAANQDDFDTARQQSCGILKEESETRSEGVTGFLKDCDRQGEIRLLKR